MLVAKGGKVGQRMAYFGITATHAGVHGAAGEGVEAGLRRRLAGVAAGVPVVVMVHGYKFDPAHPATDPHRSLYAFAPPGDCPRIRSWPAGLGFADDAGETGLAVGFGWPACAAHVPTLLRERRTGFAAVYDRAGAFGVRLAELVALVQRLAPGRPVDLVAHSLGARVALAALPHLAAAPGRVILLGAAEFDGRALAALEALRAPSRPQVYNVTARANDLYDLAFETFAPRRHRDERAVGRGLAVARPDWLDLQLDRPEVTAWVNERGIRLKPPEARLCHWGFYTRSGALAVYQAILRRRPGWDIAALRAVPGLSAQEPRWSLLLRGLGRPFPAERHVAFE
jgi:hypothetical protein